MGFLLIGFVFAKFIYVWIVVLHGIGKFASNATWIIPKPTHTNYVPALNRLTENSTSAQVYYGCDLEEGYNLWWRIGTCYSLVAGSREFLIIS